MNIFEEIRLPSVDRNTFDLSHRSLYTTSIGRITPNLCMECVPGDNIRIKMNNFTRFAPMQFPIYENIDIHQRFFFVPLRLIWSDWEDFITGGEDGTFTADAPHFLLSDFLSLCKQDGLPGGINIMSSDTVMKDNLLVNGLSTMLDYLGYPTGDQFAFMKNYNILADYQDWINSVGKQKVSSLPFRAWAQIWNDWFRDQNFRVTSEKINFSKTSGHETVHTLSAFNPVCQMLSTRNIAYKRDYFTSALPDPQRGPDVNIPIQVDGLVHSFSPAVPTDYANVIATAGTTSNTIALGNLNASQQANWYKQENRDAIIGTVNTLSTGFTINDFRHANALQKFYEINARGGSRYIEQLKSHFDVTAPDFRLQRAEYLGGDVQRVGISEVTQTSNSLGSSEGQLFENGVVGDMYGKAVSNGQSYVNHYCYEHGYLIGVSYAVPRASYSQGIHKSLQRRLREDYYFPSFAHLGEQAIANKELYIGQKESNVDPDGTFGYTPRYAEYKYLPDTIKGDFKGSMKDWHLSRFFNSTPKLNTDFIRCKEDTRIYSVEENEDGSTLDHLWSEVSFDINAQRPMPYFGTPDL